MESQPQNPEFRSNPENFHTCIVYSQHMLWLRNNFQLHTLTKRPDKY